VDHDINPELERSLDDRAGKGVVAHRDDCACAANRGNRSQVGQLEHGIGGRFDPHHPGLGPQRSEQRIKAVHVVAGDDVRAAVE
jgi:hypothetical protein